MPGRALVAPAVPESTSPAGGSPSAAAALGATDCDSTVAPVAAPARAPRENLRRSINVTTWNHFFCEVCRTLITPDSPPIHPRSLLSIHLIARSPNPLTQIGKVPAPRGTCADPGSECRERGLSQSGIRCQGMDHDPPEPRPSGASSGGVGEVTRAARTATRSPRHAGVAHGVVPPRWSPGSWALLFGVGAGAARPGRRPPHPWRVIPPGSVRGYLRLVGSGGASPAERATWTRARTKVVNRTLPGAAA